MKIMLELEMQFEPVFRLFKNLNSFQSYNFKSFSTKKNKKLNGTAVRFFYPSGDLQKSSRKNI